MIQVMDADAWEIARLVRSKEVSAMDVAKASLDCLGRDQLGAVWSISEDRALTEAAAVDSEVAAGNDPGPLAGVPVGWKDLIDTAGVRTTYGSAIYADHIPERDADVVSRCTMAGAVCVAKLATHEFAWGVSTDNPHFGTCRNPYDRDRMPGGSSGGSAVAVATRMIPLAGGTDTGGSIRCPASCCGVVGLKPTYGRVSLAGVHPLCFSYDHCGPIARSVRDCALGLEAMAGPSTRDSRSSLMPVPRYSDALARGVEGFKVGIAEHFFFEHTLADIVAPVRAAVDVLKGAGAELIEIDLNWPMPAPNRFTFYDAEQAAAVSQHWPARRAQLGDDVVQSLVEAESMTGVDAAQWIAASLEYRARMLALVDRLKVDVVVTPTQAVPPPLVGTKIVSFAGRDTSATDAMCSLTEVFNVLGWPAITLPCGCDKLGMPVGVQIVAPPWRELDCISAASVVEASGLSATLDDYSPTTG